MRHSLNAADWLERRVRPSVSERVYGNRKRDLDNNLLPAFGHIALGGLRRKHVDTYLNEFVFRYNRRFYRHVSFETMLGLASHHHPTSYWDIVGRDNPRKGVPTVRREPRRRRTATGMRTDRSRSPEKLEPSSVSGSTRQP